MTTKCTLDARALKQTQNILGLDSEGFYSLINEYMYAIIKFGKKPKLVNPDEYENIKNIILNLNKSMGIETTSEESDINADLNEYINAIKGSI